MCGEQVVDEFPNFVQRQLRGGVRIEHRRMVDVLAFAGQGRFDGEGLYVHVGHDQRRQLRRQIADACRLYAVVVHQARHLDAAAGL